ncbi:Uma2 family endonuclease [Nocardia uniformis]|uniref:Uma2 family endonuclease n=1 Tax=Nocardia uniformis TaxID=53432 RepID=A0A849C1F7_9NOCA|nr:Uma2 family endonuclease [Nocardia uniformis]NNH72583.1 Uma2 family endonuclease [Nocardia uniformis]
MTEEATLSYHWSRDEFVRAWDADVFERRVELVEGEVWPVVIGSWHGETVMTVAAVLPRRGVRISSSTLPTGDSLPDPDCWVRRRDAEPTESIGSRLAVWDPRDLLLVIEVSDETVMQDLGVKAKLYGRAGYPAYWVVTKDVIYEHTEPTASGYRLRAEYRAGDRIPIRYADTDLAVDDLLHPA